MGPVILNKKDAKNEDGSRTDENPTDKGPKVRILEERSRSEKVTLPPNFNQKMTCFVYSDRTGVLIPERKVRR